MRLLKTLLHSITLSCSLLIYAASSEDNIQPLLVGSTGDYPPLTLHKANGSWEGFAIDMAHDLANYLGRELVLVKTSWPTLHDDLSSGKFDLAMGGISFTQGRSSQFLMSEPVFHDGKVALVNCILYPYLYFYSPEDLLIVFNTPLSQDSPLRLDAIQKARRILHSDSIKTQTPTTITTKAPFQNQIQIIENPGGTNEMLAKQWFTNAAINIAHDNAEPFQLLLERKAHVMITDQVEALYRARVMSELCVLNPDTPFTNSDKVYMSRKGDSELMNQVNAWLKQVNKQAIQRRWF